MANRMANHTVNHRANSRANNMVDNTANTTIIGDAVLTVVVDKVNVVGHKMTPTGLPLVNQIRVNPRRLFLRPGHACTTLFISLRFGFLDSLILFRSIFEILSGYPGIDFPVIMIRECNVSYVFFHSGPLSNELDP